MQLTIKNDGDKRHIIFYDPNETTRFKEVELSSAEMAKNIKITDFVSPGDRHLYEFNTYKKPSDDELSDELNITIHENIVHKTLEESDAI